MFARKTSIVGRGSERRGLDWTSKCVRDRVGKSLKLSRLESDFIMGDIIVRMTDCASKTIACLKEKVGICPDYPLDQ